MALRDKTHSEEQDSIADALRGNPEAYARLMQRYGQQVFALIVRLTDDVRDAEELAQDTFVKAFRHIRMYDAGKASFSTWLFRIAYHETMNHLRKRRVATVYLADVFADEGCCADAGGEGEDALAFADADELDKGLSTGDEVRIRCMERCIGVLPVEERAVLILYYFENRPVREIAEILGVNPATLASRLYRIRRRLYGMMEKEMKKTGNL